MICLCKKNEVRLAKDKLVCWIRVPPLTFSKSDRLDVQGLPPSTRHVTHLSRSHDVTGHLWRVTTPHLDLYFRTIPVASTAFRQFPHLPGRFHVLPCFSGLFPYVLIFMTHAFPLWTIPPTLTKLCPHYGVIWHHTDSYAQSACGYAPSPLMYLSALGIAPVPQFGLLVTGTGKRFQWL